MSTMDAPLGYYRQPTIHDDRIAFVTEDDLWSVPATGGAAMRLTANPGTVTAPLYSPDGSTIAFTSRDEGDGDVHLIGSDGGETTRLTWFGSYTQVVGWSQDGAAVIVTTDWRRPFPTLMELVEVPVDGAPPRPLGFGPARAIGYEESGKGVVIGRNSADPARWKRYRGGMAGTIWIDRKGGGDFAPLVDLDGNLARPMWIGSHIYFLSDHEGHGNLYRCTPTGRNLTRLTHHEDYYARNSHTDGSTIVYHAGGDLWRYDVAAETTSMVDVSIASARPQRNRRFVSVRRNLESVDLHPKGSSVAVTGRGAVFAMDLWEGAPVRHDTASTHRYRLGSWMSDGERIVAMSDASGEERLVVFRADGEGEETTVDLDVGRPFWIEPAPAGGDLVAVTNERQEVLLVDTKKGTVKEVFQSPNLRVLGMAWSPDGRWLALAGSVGPYTTAIHLWDTATARLHQVTSGDFIDAFPSFDPGGQYLYFLSLRTFNPVADDVFFDFGFPAAGRPYLITLNADTPSPLSAAHREARAPGAPPDAPKNGQNAKNGKDEKKSPDGPPEVTIDLSGIGERVVALPFPEGRYTKVAGAAGRVLVSSMPVEGSLGSATRTGSGRPRGRLAAYDFARDKVDQVMEGMSGFSVTADGKVLAIRAGSRVRVVPSAFKDEGQGGDEPSRETGWIDLDRLRVEVRPGAEWRQMMAEAWRLQRDQFWVKNMSGVDWKRVYRKYVKLVDRVGSRAEFSDLMWEMQGELGTSHAYELLGDYRAEPTWFRGFLGADIDWDRRARAWRVSRVANGDGWLPAASSPLAAPAVDVRAGDRILAVDGETVDRRRGPDRLLADKADAAIRLTVQRGRRKPRTVVVQTLRSEAALRYRDWVETNRSIVHEATKGEVGYLHIPNMGVQGFAEFHRYFPTEVDRRGLIVDVRFNGGGNVSQLLLQKLLRKRIGYDITRHSGVVSYPQQSPMGPMVALTNEWAGSDGDIFSHAFKLYGLGPLIGTRTWGGVIGIWPRHSLVDGSITTQPEFSYWFNDVGFGVENYGTDPDIEVVIRPQDYAAGRDPQLERGLSEVQAIMAVEKPRIPAFGRKPSRKPPRLPKD